MVGLQKLSMSSQNFRRGVCANLGSAKPDLRCSLIASDIFNTSSGEKQLRNTDLLAPVKITDFMLSSSLAFSSDFDASSTNLMEINSFGGSLNVIMATLPCVL